MSNEDKPDEAIGDEQLDAMLRDVAFPVDLKSKLKLIPELTAGVEASVSIAATDRSTSSSMTSPRTSMLTYVLAASVLGIAAFAAAQWWPSSDGGAPIAQTDDGSPSDGVLGNGNGTGAGSKTDLASESLESLLAQLEESDKNLKAIRRETELARMNDSLNAQKRLGAAGLDSRQVDSMVMALSKQVVIPITGTDEDVKSEMVRVLDKFPGTRGAKLAKDFLEQSN